MAVVASASAAPGVGGSGDAEDGPVSRVLFEDDQQQQHQLAGCATGAPVADATIGSGGSYHNHHDDVTAGGTGALPTVVPPAPMTPRDRIRRSPYENLQQTLSADRSQHLRTGRDDTNQQREPRSSERPGLRRHSGSNKRRGAGAAQFHPSPTDAPVKVRSARAKGGRDSNLPDIDDRMSDSDGPASASGSQSQRHRQQRGPCLGAGSHHFVANMVQPLKLTPKLRGEGRRTDRTAFASPHTATAISARAGHGLTTRDAPGFKISPQEARERRAKPSAAAARRRSAPAIKLDIATMQDANRNNGVSSNNGNSKKMSIEVQLDHQANRTPGAAASCVPSIAGFSLDTPTKMRHQAPPSPSRQNNGIPSGSFTPGRAGNHSSSKSSQRRSSFSRISRADSSPSISTPASARQDLTPTRRRSSGRRGGSGSGSGGGGGSDSGGGGGGSHHRRMGKIQPRRSQDSAEGESSGSSRQQSREEGDMPSSSAGKGWPKRRMRRAANFTPPSTSSKIVLSSNGKERGSGLRGGVPAANRSNQLHISGRTPDRSSTTMVDGRSEPVLENHGSRESWHGGNACAGPGVAAAVGPASVTGSADRQDDTDIHTEQSGDSHSDTNTETTSRVLVSPIQRGGAATTPPRSFPETDLHNCLGTPTELRVQPLFSGAPSATGGSRHRQNPETKQKGQPSHTTHPTNAVSPGPSDMSPELSAFSASPHQQQQQQQKQQQQHQDVPANGPAFGKVDVSPLYFEDDVVVGRQTNVSMDEFAQMQHQQQAQQGGVSLPRVFEATANAAREYDKGLPPTRLEDTLPDYDANLRGFAFYDDVDHVSGQDQLAPDARAFEANTAEADDARQGTKNGGIDLGGFSGQGHTLFSMDSTGKRAPHRVRGSEESTPVSDDEFDGGAAADGSESDSEMRHTHNRGLAESPTSARTDGGPTSNFSSPRAGACISPLTSPQSVSLCSDPFRATTTLSDGLSSSAAQSSLDPVDGPSDEDRTVVGSAFRGKHLSMPDNGHGHAEPSAAGWERDLSPWGGDVHKPASPTSTSALATTAAARANSDSATAKPACPKQPSQPSRPPRNNRTSAAGNPVRRPNNMLRPIRGGRTMRPAKVADAAKWLSSTSSNGDGAGLDQGQGPGTASSGGNGGQLRMPYTPPRRTSQGIQQPPKSSATKPEHDLEHNPTVDQVNRSAPLKTPVQIEKQEMGSARDLMASTLSPFSSNYSDVCARINDSGAAAEAESMHESSTGQRDCERGVSDQHDYKGHEDEEDDEYEFSDVAASQSTAVLKRSWPVSSPDKVIGDADDAEVFGSHLSPNRRLSGSGEQTVNAGADECGDHSPSADSIASWPALSGQGPVTASGDSGENASDGLTAAKPGMPPPRFGLGASRVSPIVGGVKMANYVRNAGYQPCLEVIPEDEACTDLEVCPEHSMLDRPFDMFEFAEYIGEPYTFASSLSTSNADNSGNSAGVVARTVSVSGLASDDERERWLQQGEQVDHLLGIPELRTVMGELAKVAGTHTVNSADVPIPTYTVLGDDEEDTVESLEDTVDLESTQQGPKGKQNWQRKRMRRRGDEYERWMFSQVSRRGPFEFSDLFEHVFLHEFDPIVDAVESQLLSVDDIQDDKGNTLFLAAAHAGWRRLARFCVKAGANINARNMFGNTALHYAVEFGHASIVDFLRKKGATESGVNALGLTCHQRICHERTASPQQIIG